MAPLAPPGRGAALQAREWSATKQVSSLRQSGQHHSNIVRNSLSRRAAGGGGGGFQIF
jgi:hypothetical protein